MNRLLFAAALSAALTGCATAPKDFYANPARAKETSLCRTVMEATDPIYQKDVSEELVRRGLTWEDCQNKVNAENAAILGIAAVATGVAVVAACQNGCAAPAAYSSPKVDVDCYGGTGDGPQFVRGPFRLNGPDYYHLDADKDGIACEPYGDYGS